jgi:hypothetical protein
MVTNYILEGLTLSQHTNALSSSQATSHIKVGFLKKKFHFNSDDRDKAGVQMAINST